MQAVCLSAQVGTWRAYMAYSDVTDVQKAGNTLYVLASNSLYTYNTNDKSIQTYDKTNGMSDCEIKLIAWCQSAKRLLIAYSNGNFDIMDSDGSITNLPDFYNKVMTDDKTIYDINVVGKYAYVSTGFGILKINVSNASIDETYDLGFRVDYSYISDGNIYAASSTNGVYMASMSQSLQDPSNWSYSTWFTSNTKVIDSDLLALVKTLSPGGPKYNYFGYLKFADNKLYTCNGLLSVLQAAAIQVLDGDNWVIYQDEDIAQSTGVQYQDVYAVEPDPLDYSHVYGAARNGLYEYRNGSFINYYSYKNSPIERYDRLDAEYQLITGLKCCSNGSLYILNSQAPTQSLIELTGEGNWVSHSFPELMKFSAGGISNKSLAYLSNMIVDSRGLVWFVNNHWSTSSFYSFQPSDNTLRSFVPDVNQDGTTIVNGGVTCVVEDDNGNMWIGTTQGPLLLNAEDVYSDTPTYNQVKVPRNDGTNLADYLLSGVNITSIVIDGAGRKWFGSNGNGVYLISSDNMTQLQHFTANNSPLLSDNIQSLAINKTTGELYIGTDKGLCSYKSDATEAVDEMTKDNVYAYPNPVNPEYTGMITVVGLSSNADVKIVSSNGSLIYSGRSNGGTFQWDGCDSKGKKVASGVYNVVTATNEGKKGTVTRIAIIR